MFETLLSLHAISKTDKKRELSEKFWTVYKLIDKVVVVFTVLLLRLYEKYRSRPLKNKCCSDLKKLYPSLLWTIMLNKTNKIRNIIVHVFNFNCHPFLPPIVTYIRLLINFILITKNNDKFLSKKKGWHFFFKTKTGADEILLKELHVNQINLKKASPPFFFVETNLSLFSWSRKRVIHLYLGLILVKTEDPS